MDRRARGPDPVRDDEGDRAPLPRCRQRARGAVVGRRHAGPDPRGRARLQPARADAARARVRAGDEPSDASGGDGRRRGRRPRAGVGAARDAAQARRDRVALPRDGPSDRALRAPPATREPRRRDLDRHPRVRRRALVGAPAAQPDGAAAEGPTPVRAVGDGYQRPVGARHRRAGGGIVMSISARLEYVKTEDLLDEEAPAPRHPRLSLSRRRQVSGLALTLLGLPLLTLLLNGTTSSLSLEGEVLIYLLAVVVIAIVGGVIVAVF